MTPNKNIDRLYPPKYFNDSAVNNILITKEQNIMVVLRDKEYEETYTNFDNLFSTYLNKLSSSSAKKYVSHVFDKKLVFIGNSIGQKNDAVFSRVLQSGKAVNGIALDSSVLDIDVLSGDTSSIDDCVYATYFGIVRSAVMADTAGIARDTDLHKLLVQILYLLMLKGAGQKSIYNKKQKSLIYLACVYCYFAHFLDQKHNAIISNVKKNFSSFVDKDMFDEFLPLLANIKKYRNVKDIPKALVDLKVYNDNPSKMFLELFKLLGNTGFYSLISSLDQFIAMCVVSKYPSNLYNKGVVTSIKVHDGVEEIMNKYIERVSFKTSMMLYGNKK